MSACVQCGSQLIERATFCPACGRPTDPPDGSARPAYQPGALASFQPPPPGGYRPNHSDGYQPNLSGGYQPGSGPAYPHAGTPHLAAHRFAGRPAWSRSRSGWTDAVVAVTSGVLVTAALVAIALMIGFGASPFGGPSASQFIRITGMGTVLAVGGSVDVGNSFIPHTSLSYQLLGPAVSGFALLGRIYVRRLLRTGKPTLDEAAAQAGRCAVVMCVALLLVVGLSHVGTGYGPGSPTANIGTTLLFGMITLAVALVVAGLLGLSGLLPARAERVRAIIAVPLRGIVVMFVWANVITLILVLVKVNQALSASPLAGSGLTGGAWGVVAMVVVLALPNMTTVALLMGMGVPVSSGFAGLTDLGAGDGRALSVFDLVKQDQFYWIWPLVVGLLVVLTGVTAGRRSPRTVGGWSTAPVLAVVLPAVLLCLSLMSNGNGSDVVPAKIGSDSNVGLVLIAGVGWGLLGGLIGMALAGRRRPTVPPRHRPHPPPFRAPGYPPAPPPGLPRPRYPLALPPGRSGPGYPPALPPGAAEPPDLPRLGYPSS